MDEGLTDVDIMLMRKLEELRTQVIYTDTAIPKIYAKCIAELTAEGVDHENANTPPSVDDTDDIVLDGEFVVCQDGKSHFLLFDSKDEDRIIGFTSDTCLNILSKSGTWHVDDEATYKKMIMLLRDRLFELGFNVAPVKLVTDFVLATIKAFKSQFGLRIIGSHFNFLQAVRRAIDTIGLKTAYKKQEIQKVLKIWMGLSFVPIDLMSEAIEIANEKKNELYNNLETIFQPVQTEEEQITSNFVAIGRGRGRGRGRPRGSTAQRLTEPIAIEVDQNVNSNDVIVSGRSRGKGRGRVRGRGRGRGCRVGCSTAESNVDISLIKSNLEEFFDYFVKQWFERSIEYEMWNQL
ncbi:unnamed protein product [Brachionus calyciflorus]|uniref:Uncharacterized protein n=1 Tax=Brachionus calyciflorus TaxID=104777 RepID=A0A813N3C9_9BILA|nr:unnamed protein product [Brachionus calyciflorus]